MSMALTGDAGDPNDPLLFVLPTIAVDEQVLRGPIEKDRLEDIQTWSWLLTMARLGAVESHPVASWPGEDPPDRYVGFGEKKRALELTELTIQDFRQQLSAVRQVGRTLSALIADNPEKYSHLSNRRVCISAMVLNADSRAPEVQSAASIAAELEADLGYVGQQPFFIDASAPLPQTLPTNGFYGTVAGFSVQVYEMPGDRGVPALVSASCQLSVPLSEIRALLNTRIGAKDVETNDILLITTGLPDKAGYICPADSWLFSFLRQHGLGEIDEPKHLRLIMLHDLTTGEMIEIYNSLSARGENA